MTTMTVFKMSGSPDELLKELEKAITGKDGDKPRPGMEDLIGLERKPHERVAAAGRPPEKATRSQESALLTLRDDLLEMRMRLLKGASRRATLRDLDYTVDRIDNLLAEM